MRGATHHTFETTWDAPLLRVRVAYCFTRAVPEQGPSYASGGEPAEPAEVEPISCSALVGGAWHDMPACVRDEMAELLRDDLVDYANGEREDWQAEARAAAREAA